MDILDDMGVSKKVVFFFNYSFKSNAFLNKFTQFQNPNVIMFKRPELYNPLSSI